MDLLRHIWARLPLQNLIILSKDEDQFSQQFIDLRTRVTNQLFETDPPKESFLNSADSYIKLCTFQGELCQYSHLYMPSETLLDRAAFLRDADWYHFFANRRTGRWRPSRQSALETDIPEIQARVLSITGMSTLINPEIINWSPGLHRYYRSELEPFAENPLYDHNDVYVHGYFNTILLKDAIKRFSQHHLKLYVMWYIKGCLSRKMAPKLDDYYEHTGGTLFFAESLIGAGYWDSRLECHRSDIIRMSLRHIQPKFLRQLTSLPQLQEFAGSEEINVDVTPEVVERAMEMQTILCRLGVSAGRYMEDLRIILGQPVEITERSEDHINWPAEVAHPQLKRVENLSVETPFNTFYDLINTMKVLPIEYLSSTPMRQFSVVRLGQTYQCRHTPIFSHMWNPRPEADIHQWDVFLLEQYSLPDDAVPTPNRPLFSVSIELLEKLRQYGRKIPASEFICATDVDKVSAFYGKPIRYFATVGDYDHILAKISDGGKIWSENVDPSGSRLCDQSSELD